MSALRANAIIAGLRRFSAAGCAALVFALTVFAASPLAHDWLHASDAHEDEAGCAVVLFASGVALPLAAPAIEPPNFVTDRVALATGGDVDLVTPRYLRQPERGPPALG